MTITKYTIPLLVVMALLGGYFLRDAFTRPTTAVFLSQLGDARLECTVEGLKCKGTATFFTKMYEGTRGIRSVETFATEHLAVFKYDPEVISASEIRAIMEASVTFKDGSSRPVFKCLAMK